jgi:hypothetical protein
MKKLIIFLGMLWLFAACAELQAILGDVSGGGSKGLTEQEVVRGLRNALEVGTDTSVTLLSRANGYFQDAAVRVLLPSEITQAISQLRSTSAGENIYRNSIQKIESDMLLSLNRAAEKAADKARTILKDAIRNITIQDAFGILQGADNAATEYLRARTFNSLSNAFQPDIRQVLNEPLVLNMSTDRIYKDFINAYNTVVDNDRLGLLKIQRIQQRDLTAYVTERALNGLFIKIADEERDIRRDPQARVTEILRKVFGS